MIMISCEEVRRELSNYIDDEVTPEVRARIDEHVRFCPGCKAVYDGVRNVLTLVGSGDIIELPRGFSLRLFERLAGRRELAIDAPPIGGAERDGLELPACGGTGSVQRRPVQDLNRED